MQINLKIVSTFLCLMFINALLQAQTGEWITKKSNEIIVKYKFSKRILTNGKEELIVEYVATTTTYTNMNRLVSIMKDVTKHKFFMSQKTSMIVKMPSVNEYIVYYFYEGFWPYPSSDIVARVIFNEDIEAKITTFTFTATPLLFENRGVKRLDNYDLTYLFKDIGNGKIVISVMSKFTPAVQMPIFIMKTWFPHGPADYIKNLIKLTNKSQ